MNLLRASLFITLSVIALSSSLIVILHTYEHKIAFSLVDDLKLKNGELAFQSSVLVEEVQYFRNQLTLRRIAQNKLGMRSPKQNEKIFVEVIKK